MAGGHVNREKQAEHMAAPPPVLRREDFPCQHGAVHTWPIASFRCAAEFGRYRGIADIEQTTAIKLDL